MQNGSSMLGQIIDHAEHEAAAGVPQMYGARCCSGLRSSLEHGQQLPADAEAPATGGGGHPFGRTPIRQELFWYEGDAEPLWWDAEDIFSDAEDIFADAEDVFADASLDCSTSAAPER